MIIIFHHLILFILASISVSTGIVGRVNAQEQQQQQQQQEAEEDKTLEISYINVRFHSDTLQFMDMQIVGHIEPKYYNFYFWYFGYDADELREPVSPEYEEYAEEYAKVTLICFSFFFFSFFFFFFVCVFVGMVREYGTIFI